MPNIRQTSMVYIHAERQRMRACSNNNMRTTIINDVRRCYTCYTHSPSWHMLYGPHPIFSVYEPHPFSACVYMKLYVSNTMYTEVYHSFIRSRGSLKKLVLHTGHLVQKSSNRNIVKMFYNSISKYTKYVYHIMTKLSVPVIIIQYIALYTLHSDCQSIVNFSAWFKLL